MFRVRRNRHDGVSAKPTVAARIALQLDTCHALASEFPNDRFYANALEAAQQATAAQDVAGKDSQHSALALYAQSVLASWSATRDRWADSEPFVPDPNVVVSILSHLNTVFRTCAPDADNWPDRIVACTRLIKRELVDTLLMCGLQACYMYCSGLITNGFADVLRDPQTLLLVECAVCLALTITRVPHQGSDVYDESRPGGKDVARLLLDGIWSDGNLLALMYGGEICYWVWEQLSLAGKVGPEEAVDEQGAVATAADPEDNASVGKMTAATSQAPSRDDDPWAPRAAATTATETELKTAEASQAVPADGASPQGTNGDADPVTTSTAASTSASQQGVHAPPEPNWATMLCANAMCASGDPGCKACSRCRSVFYCCGDCQKQDWATAHKRVCIPQERATFLGIARAWHHDTRTATGVLGLASGQTTHADRCHRLRTCGLRLLERYMRHVSTEPALRGSWSVAEAQRYAKALKADTPARATQSE
eukprot:m.53980 g.53980  ORF g.53980 m.53980 type:complete len:483 (+) comp12426_c0_seq2:158-1606(+)